MKLQKKQRYPWEVIETSVKLYLRGNISHRSVSEKMMEIGVKVSHKTIFTWVNSFSKNVNTKNYKEIIPYSIEESCVKCNGEIMVMYRAVNEKKSTVGIFFRRTRNLGIAKKFFSKNIVK